MFSYFKKASITFGTYVASYVKIFLRGKLFSEWAERQIETDSFLERAISNLQDEVDDMAIVRFENEPRYLPNNFSFAFSDEPNYHDPDVLEVVAESHRTTNSKILSMIADSSHSLPRKDLHHYFSLWHNFEDHIRYFQQNNSEEDRQI